MCLEWWAYEVLVFIAGLADDAAVQTAAVDVTFVISMLLWAAQSGVAETANVRIANALGAGSAAGARASLAVCLGLSTTLAAASAGAFLAFRAPLLALFTRDAAVLGALEAAAPWLAASLVASSASEILFAVLNACGRQLVGAGVNLGVYYALGVPAAAYAALSLDMGVRGMWMAVTAALALQGAVLGVYVGCCLSFDREVLRAEALLARQQKRRRKRRGGVVSGLTPPPAPTRSEERDPLLC
jgi:MATE family multidrug resistance protein